MYDKILVIDDSKLNGNLIKKYLAYRNLETVHAVNGQIALDILEKDWEQFGCITLDRQMPVMDGLEFASKIKHQELFKDIPIIIVSSMSEKIEILEGLEVGVYDYIIKPVDGDFLYLKVRNAIEFYNQKIQMKKLNIQIVQENEHLEEIVEERTKRLQDVTNAILNVLEKATSISDEVTGNHIQRVSAYSELLAKEALLPHEIISEIKAYSPLHDIGKIGISESILKKPGPLTTEEFEKMKEHVNIGSELLREAKLPEIAVNIIKYHHEKWNGKGYCEGLSKNDIPIEARIVSIADVFDALTTERPYKKAFSIEEAIRIMKEEMYDSFDPQLLELFLCDIEKIQKIKEKLED